MNHAALTLDRLRVFKQDTELCCVSATVEPGQILTITGTSGKGKSSLLAAVAGLLSTDLRMSGRVLLAKQDITHLPAHARHLGLLFQDPLLYEHMNVAQNIGFGMAPASRRSKQARVLEMLQQVGLESCVNSPVQSLSGGQQSRVALLRTLASNPNALLLDEPFSKLDSATRQQTRQWVFSQINTYQLPAILVTHDAQDVRAAGGQVIEI